MARVAFLVLLCGCKQLFGIDEASAPASSDGPIAIDMTVDQPIDMPVEAGAAVTVTFRNGDNNYTGTLDTCIDGINPNANNGGDSQITVRKPDRSVLIQFTGIFGNAVGQIPDGVTITSASLDLVAQQISSTGTIYEVVVAWAEDTSLNTFGPDPGIDPTDVGDAVVAFAPMAAGLSTFDVTTSVTKWSTAAIPNNGWIISGEAGGGSDTKLRSSEDGVIANRPALHVTYIAGP